MKTKKWKYFRTRGPETIYRYDGYNFEFYTSRDKVWKVSQYFFKDNFSPYDNKNIWKPMSDEEVFLALL